MYTDNKYDRLEDHYLVATGEVKSNSVFIEGIEYFTDCAKTACEKAEEICRSTGKEVKIYILAINQEGRPVYYTGYKMGEDGRMYYYSHQAKSGWYPVLTPEEIKAKREEEEAKYKAISDEIKALDLVSLYAKWVVDKE